MNPFERTFKNGQGEDHKQHQQIESLQREQQDSTSSLIGSKDDREEVLARIEAYKSTFKGPKKQRFSQRIVLGAHHDMQATVCASTGIVYAVMLPAIPQKAFIIESPFSSYANCRGMVQEGPDFLRKQSAQILAGILITMAENYSLLRYQPSDTGVQKNALLRTIEREVLIDALVFIEHWVNTNSALYIPKFSIILDDETKTHGLNSRMKEWLKVALEAVYKPDMQSYEEATAVRRSISVPTVSKAKKEALAAKKEFRAWRKDAKEDIAELFAAKLISFKLKTYLSAVLTEENIANADSAMIILLCNKLDSIESATAHELAVSIEDYHNRLSVGSSTDWDEDAPSFASGNVGDTLSTQTEGQTAPLMEASPTEASIEAPAQSAEQEENHPVASALPALSFMEKLKAKKAAEKAAQNNSVGDQDASN